MQINRRDRVSWLIFDIEEGDGQRWEAAGLPPPNLIVQTVDGERVRGAHLYYAIAPVCTSPRGRSEPIQYQRAVYASMAASLRSDLAYHGGPVAKTPGHPLWRTWEIHSHEYTLGELAEYIDLPQRRRGNVSEQAAESRNCALFDACRFFAYSIVGKARDGSFEPFYDRLLAFNEAHNDFGRAGHAKGDLRHSDLRAIAKSVARWTWDKYRGSARMRGTMHFDPALTTKERQQAAAARTHSLRNQSTLAKLMAALASLQSGGELIPTDAGIARTAGVDRRTVARYRARLEEALAASAGRLVGLIEPTVPEGHRGPLLTLQALLEALKTIAPRSAHILAKWVPNGVHQITTPRGSGRKSEGTGTKSNGAGDGFVAFDTS